jgi:hypothetical protein
MPSGSLDRYRQTYAASEVAKRIQPLYPSTKWGLIAITQLMRIVDGKDAVKYGNIEELDNREMNT